MRNRKVRVDQSFSFVFLITFLGGFINAYSFFVRGGVFISMHTGNMAKIGIAVYENDMIGFFSALLPIVGCLIGTIIAQILKHYTQKESHYFQRHLSIGIELVALLITAFIPLSVNFHFVCFFLSITTGYQLGVFRSFEGAGHNTTIASGNIRTLGNHIGDCIIQKDTHTFFITFKYFFILISFPFGAFAGAFISNLYGQYAIAFGCLVLMTMSIILILDYREKHS